MNGMMFFDTLAQQPPCSYLFKNKSDMNVLNNNNSGSLEALSYGRDSPKGDQDNHSSGGGLYRPISPRDYCNDENFAPQETFKCSSEENRIKYSQRNGFTQQTNNPTLVFVNSFRDNYHNPSSNPQYYRNHNYDKTRSHQNWSANNNNNESKENHKRPANSNRFPRTDVMFRRAYGLSHRFRSRSNIMKIDPNPEKLVNGGPLDHMNQAIYDVFVSKAQKTDTYRNKISLWNQLFLYMRRCLNHYALYIVGSTMTGFGLDSSDIDMCLLIRPCTEDPRMDSLQHLNNIKHHFVRYGLTIDPELILAKVPILKFREESTGFEIDLNCNNSVGIHNTHLLYCYARLDWRVRPLVVMVKIWAQTNSINDAKNLTVSSYSWTLMVINYLQCGIHPVVLPCLHTLYPNLFNPEKSRITDVHEDIPLFDNFKSENTMTLAELLIGFFQYYSYFDFNQYAVSVRTGTKLSIEDCRNCKALKNDIHQWKYLCIEEPFDFTNTARSVYDLMAFRHIKNIVDRSYETLINTNDLSSILPVNVGDQVPRFMGYQGERETLV